MHPGRWSAMGVLAAGAASAMALGLAGCGAARTTTVTTTVTGPTQTVTTTTTATTTATTTTSAPTSPDASAFLEKSLTDKIPGNSGLSTHSFLQNSYPGATIDVTGAKCVEAGTTEHYQCIVSYTVSGASDSTQDGSYTLGATGSCDSAGNCQTNEDAVATASRQ